MPTDHRLDIIVDLKNKVDRDLDMIRGQLQSIGKQAMLTSGQTDRATSDMMGQFRSLGGIVASTIAAFGAWQWFKGFTQITSAVEQARISFETLLGSVESARDMLKDIDTFAAKTPFQKLNLIPLTQQLIGMGFEAQKTLPTLQILGDSIAALGRGQDDLNGVVLALGQVQTKGKLSTEEMLQFAERGLPVFEILEEKLWLTKKQLGDLGNVGIDSATAISAILTGLNERFAGAMEAQNKTLQGQWSNLVDNIQSLVGNAGQETNEKMTSILKDINEFFSENYSYIFDYVGDMLYLFVELGKQVGEIVGGIGGMFNDLFEFIVGSTDDATTKQLISFKGLFMSLVNGLSVVHKALDTIGAGISSSFSIVANIVGSIFDTVVWLTINALNDMYNAAIKLINPLIQSYNFLAEKIGLGMLDPLQDIKAGYDAASSFIGDSWKSTMNQIDAAGEALAERVKKNYEDATMAIANNYIRVTDSTDQAAGSFEELKNRIDASIASMEENLNGIDSLTQGIGKSADWVKETVKELEKISTQIVDQFLKDYERYEDTIEDLKLDAMRLRESMTSGLSSQKSKLLELSEGYKDMRKQLREIGQRGREDLNKLSDTLKEIGEEGSKSLAKIDERINEMRRSIDDIANEGRQDIAGRAVELQDEIAEIQKSIDKLDADLLQERSINLGENRDEIDKMQEEMEELIEKRNALEGELSIATGSVSGAELAEARAQAEKTITEEIMERIAAEQQEKAKQIEALKQEREEEERAIEERAQEVTDAIEERSRALEEEQTEFREKMDERKQQIIDEYEVYKDKLEERKELDRGYFAFFEEQIRKSMTPLEEYWKQLDQVMSLESQVQSRIPSEYQLSLAPQEVQQSAREVILNIGTINVSNEADEDRLLKKMRRTLVDDAKLARLKIYN